jgi:hypothetical protein
MISITTDQPLEKAVERIQQQRPHGSSMGSAEWELLPAELRDRAFFSARVESERILAEMKVRLQARLELAQRDGRTVDRGVFMEEMRQILKDEKYQRPDGVKRGSLQDLKSHRRLGLIFDMNVAQAQGYARWKSGMDPDVLKASPAQELIRVRSRMEHRDWPRIWQQAGGKFYGMPGKDYPNAPGRMIALKTDPIWTKISRFGTPWPPFDWGSGMGLKSIRRAEAESLQVVPHAGQGGDDSPPPPVVPVSFNAGHRMSAEGIPEVRREEMRSDMGDSIRFDGPDVVMHRDLSPETHEQRKLEISESLRQRARGHYLQAIDRLGRLQRSDDGAEVGFRGEGESAIASIYLAQAAAVSVGRKQLFHDTMTQAQAEAFIGSMEDFPRQVRSRYDDRTGDLIVWRDDLVTAPAEELMAAQQRGEGGMLLGYGLDRPAMGQPHVLVRIYATPRREGDAPVVGFHAPITGWRTYAAARARDIEHAWGVKTETQWEVRL